MGLWEGMLKIRGEGKALRSDSSSNSPAEPEASSCPERGQELRAPVLDPDTERAKLLWDEYKYRHDLIWKNIYKITAALVALSVVPYTKEVASQAFTGYFDERTLHWLLLVPPALAVVVALYAIIVMDNELHLFQQIKEEYREFRSRLNFKLINEQGTSNFQVFVRVYLIVLYVLVATNFVFVAWSLHNS